MIGDLGRESRNTTGIEKPIHGPVPEDKPPLRPAMTGVHHIATGGRMLTTLLEIGAIGRKRLSAQRTRFVDRSRSAGEGRGSLSPPASGRRSE